jgi:hypothetical protein
MEVTNALTYYNWIRSSLIVQAAKLLNSRVGSWPYAQTLDKIGRSCAGQAH